MCVLCLLSPPPPFKRTLGRRGARGHQPKYYNYFFFYILRTTTIPPISLTQRWDDVVRVVRVEEKKRARLVELSDDKHKEGLGEIYEKEYVAAKTGAGVAGEGGWWGGVVGWVRVAVGWGWQARVAVVGWGGSVGGG